jgi:23S rRNA pseudouridine2605 synthase
MRLNKYIAQNTSYSRRAADQIISQGKVKVNGAVVEPGREIGEHDKVYIDSTEVSPSTSQTTTVLLNKPAGYVCSRNGQGNPTVYELLPADLQHLNYAGRLDKDSSGLLVMTNDGELINSLTHPSRRKTKTYEVRLDKPLEPLHQRVIRDQGVKLEDGLSRLTIEKSDRAGQNLVISMHEGRNRQIRRTFESLGYKIQRLHRVKFGPYTIRGIKEGRLHLVI